MIATETNAKLANDLSDVVRDAEELMKATAGQSSERLSEIRNRLNAAMESAKVTCRKLQGKAVEAAKATDHTIREHPYESIGVAFGVGILIGVLIGRRQ